MRQDNPLPVEARRQSLLAITSRLLMSGGEAIRIRAMTSPLGCQGRDTEAPTQQRKAALTL